MFLFIDAKIAVQTRRSKPLSWAEFVQVVKLARLAFSPGLLRALWRKSVFLASAPPNFNNPTNLRPTPPPRKFDHKKGFEIETEHKNAIRELYGFGEKLTE